MAFLRRLLPLRRGARGTGSGFPISLLIAGLLAGSLAVGMTVRSAREQIQQLSTAKADAVQFSLAQFDVEFLRLRLALSEAAVATDPALDEVRLRFDIFFSRAQTFTRGQLYAPLRDSPEIADAYLEISGFLRRTVASVDASDAELTRALPRIAAESAALTGAVRTITISGLNVFSELSDRQRKEAHDVLTRLAWVLTCLFGSLVLQVLWLGRLLQTSRRRAAEIADAARRQEAIVAASIDGIALLDGRGRIVETNAAAAEMFDCDPARARGTQLLDLMDPDPDATANAEAPFRFLAEGRRPDRSERRFELMASSRTGRRFPVEVSVDRAEMDQCGLYVIFVRDISARKAAEEALTTARDRAEAGERAKARFLAVMSHEMRTPLNGLLGSIQLLQDRELDSEESACLDTIRVSGAHLLELVNDVLDLSKLETGDEVARREPTDPAALVERVLLPLRPLAQAAGTELDWRWVGRAEPVLALDIRRLGRVLVNLVGNAIKFTSGGRVSVELTMTPGRDLEIRVADTGIGIPPEDLERIFEDFERLDSSYARKAEGTGLGLGICRRLMTVMGGEIAVDSRAGAGSTFTLRFPAATVAPPARLAPPDRPSGAPSATRPLSILVVDDNAVNRFVLRGMLTRMGHAVTEAVDGRSGIAAIGAGAFDLVLMDISMPDMDGMEATRRIRAGAGPGRDLPIVAVTAHALTGELADFDTAGMDAVISKPVDRARLAETIARLSAGRRAAPALSSA